MCRTFRLMLPAIAIALCAAGCGVGRTASEVDRDARRVANMDAHMLVDDLTLLLQLDRPLRTSRWVVE
ncbi:MAG: hypothetical protein V3T70_09130 [Phycisphaerae bacterium]